MNLYTLPIAPAGAPAFKFQTDLDGVTFSFSFQWNETAAAWFMTIGDAEENPLVSGLRVVVGFPLANRVLPAGFFTGLLYAVDTSGQDLDPALDDFGTRVLLKYLSTVADG